MPLKILIADDNTTERLILSKVLNNYGHSVIQASDGKEAIKLFQQDKPDMVFLDVLMPEFDGYEVAEEIKKSPDQSWFPIIFLTSLTEAHDLAKCIDVGGDDFVSKPINKIIIKAKVDAFERILNLYATVEDQRERIQYHHEHLVQEQEAAKRIFNNIAHRGCLESSNINYHLSPMSIFNGDLMLASKLPMGGMRLLLADFTGHGLPAAIGAMPTSEIFYGMTTKGFSIPDMMTEMNMRLYNVLPRGIFCCVIVIDIDSLDERMTIWNAGAPDCYLINQKTETLERINSCHLPLGIQSPSKFKVDCKSFEFGRDHKIIAVTDGIIEAEQADGSMFGENRMVACIEENIAEQDICASLMSSVETFTGNIEQTDDLSLLEVSFPSVREDELPTDHLGISEATGVSDSILKLKLRRKSLGTFDPIPLFLQTLTSCKELVPHRARLFTVLSELYNNALDHGVLGLDSKLKQDSSGFAKYYQQRMDRLNNISEGYVDLSVDHRPTSDGGQLVFELTDTGAGFDIDKVISEGSKTYSGRGLPLLFKLCDSIEYLEDGSQVKAIYSWRHNDIPE